MLAAQRYCNQGIHIDDSFSTDKAPAVAVLDYDGDIDMEDVEGIEAQCLPGIGSAVSLSDSHAVMPAS